MVCAVLLHGLKKTNLRHSILFFITFVFSFCSYAQELKEDMGIKRKGDMYVYFGWNLSAYGKSDIRFKGDNYDFTLDDVKAYDRQSSWDPEKYFNPASITIPQYNFRIGYYINDKYSISLGADHMKYVVAQDQQVTINGRIANTSTLYNGVYRDEQIELDKSFLSFEHTDGLNYINLGLRRMDNLFNKKNLQLNILYGAEAGVLIPKTNTRLLDKDRYDQFHVSGYGTNLVAGLHLQVFKYFFVQTEFKGGYINMPDIRTTQSITDSASQDFLFRQINLVYGVRFNL